MLCVCVSGGGWGRLRDHRNRSGPLEQSVPRPPAARRHNLQADQAMSTLRCEHGRSTVNTAAAQEEAVRGSAVQAAEGRKRFHRARQHHGVACGRVGLVPGSCQPGPPSTWPGPQRPSRRSRRSRPPGTAPRRRAGLRRPWARGARTSAGSRSNRAPVCWEAQEQRRQRGWEVEEQRRQRGQSPVGFESKRWTWGQSSK